MACYTLIETWQGKFTAQGPTGTDQPPSMTMNLLSPKQSGLVPASNKHAWAWAEEIPNGLLCLLTSAPHLFFLTLWYIITAMQWWLFEVCRASFPLCLQMAIKASTAAHILGVKAGAPKVSATTTFLAPVHCGQLLTLSENPHGVTHTGATQATKAAVHQRCCFVQSTSWCGKWCGESNWLGEQQC